MWNYLNRNVACEENITLVRRAGFALVYILSGSTKFSGLNFIDDFVNAMGFVMFKAEWQTWTRENR